MLPELPRERWAEHPHFPRQTLLLGSHENFRRISRHLVDQVRAGAPLGPLSVLFQRWVAAMRSHEAYEEFKLYPFLEQRWDVSFAEGRRGHEALHAADRSVRRALYASDDEASDRSRLVEALEHHDRLLDEHLRHEESLVIPGLLGLSPSEFDAYYRS